MEENIIEKLKLSEQEVINIVSEWYLNGMYPDVLQNEYGHELCEITEELWEEKEREKESKLNNN
tara:strand:- start:1028 stop:1219 length:192 start_codon:yes stop_codon:yes gene_type:complete